MSRQKRTELGGRRGQSEETEEVRERRRKRIECGGRRGRNEEAEEVRVRR
jgi:hypothetical protein